MPADWRLGGFKLLNDLVWVSVTDTRNNLTLPTDLCRVLAEAKINLVFFTCARNFSPWGIHLAAAIEDADKISKTIEVHFPRTGYISRSGSILSLFPHKSDFRVTCSLLKVLRDTGVSEYALANSTSAISALLPDECVDHVTTALFNVFRFNAYRTPSDWKLAQEGKETLYKEVVASYQEKRPKVYLLQWGEALEVLELRLVRNDPTPGLRLLRKSGEAGIAQSFLVTAPHDSRHTHLFLSLPEAKKPVYEDALKVLSPSTVASRFSVAAQFSMNGPHFGDRYGISRDILSILDARKIELFGLSCSIASITGIVPSDQILRALESIQECFEVPSVVRKEI